MDMSQLRPENQISVIMNSLFIWKLLEISRIISWNQEIRSCVHPVKQYLSQQETQKLLLRSQLDIQMWRDNCLYTKNHHTFKSIANTLETQCDVNPCVRKWFCCPEVVFVTKGNCKWCPDDIYFCKKKNQRGLWHMISTGTSSEGRIKKKKKAIILAEVFWQISNISLYPEAVLLKQNLQTIFATSTG